MTRRNGKSIRALDRARQALSKAQAYRAAGAIDHILTMLRPTGSPSDQHARAALVKARKALPRTAGTHRPGSDYP